jgi:hypothetical protein
MTYQTTRFRDNKIWKTLFPNFSKPVVRGVLSARGIHLYNIVCPVRTHRPGRHFTLLPIGRIPFAVSIFEILNPMEDGCFTWICFLGVPFMTMDPGQLPLFNSSLEPFEFIPTTCKEERNAVAPAQRDPVDRGLLKPLYFWMQFLYEVSGEVM